MSKPMTRTPEQVAAFRKIAEGGGTIRAAALAAGYSKATVSQGRRELPVELQTILNGVRKHIELGKTLNPLERASYIRGRALAAAEAGTDRGAQMLKLLAQDREVNMLVADTQIGVIVLGESKRIDALEESEGLLLGQEPTQPEV